MCCGRVGDGAFCCLSVSDAVPDVRMYSRRYSCWTRSSRYLLRDRHWVMPPAIMEGTIIVHSRTKKIMLFWFRTLHPTLIDGFEDILDKELHQDEVFIYLISWSRLLRVRKWLLLESTSSTNLIVDGGVSVMRIWFFFIVAAIERLASGAFHCLL